MKISTVTTSGQVSLRKEVLQPLGIRPGEKIVLDLFAEGRALLKAVRPAASIAGSLGLLAGRISKVATLDKIDAAPSSGWAARASESRL